MLISLGRLRGFLRETWYHGSPYEAMGSAADFKGPYIFLTDSEQVAGEYKEPLPAAGKRPEGVKDGPSRYEVELLFDASSIFDTRIPEHMTVFREMVKQALLEDREEPMLTMGDLTRVHATVGSNLGGTFPSYGCVRYLSGRLRDLGYKAAYIAEGSQGASLMVMDPQTNVNFVSHQSG
jgi:hypothetical protein